MALHNKTKESALKKFGHLEGDTLLTALQNANNNYAPDEIQEIIEVVEKQRPAPGAQPGPAPKVETIAGPEKPAALALSGRPIIDPNAGIRDELQAFDYGKMTGEPFKRYCLFVQSLQLEDKYDFELYSVEVVKQIRYRGVQGSPVDVVGFKLKNTTPVNRTRIPVKHALTNNGRVEPFREADGSQSETGFETIGCQLEHGSPNGRYYLLKK